MRAPCRRGWPLHYWNGFAPSRWHHTIQSIVRGEGVSISQFFRVLGARSVLWSVTEATSNNEVGKIGPVPADCGENRPILRCRPQFWNRLRTPPCLPRFLRAAPSAPIVLTGPRLSDTPGQCRSNKSVFTGATPTQCGSSIQTQGGDRSAHRTRYWAKRFLHRLLQKHAQRGASRKTG